MEKLSGKAGKLFHCEDFFGLLCECQKAVHKRVVLPRPAVNSADFYLSLSHSKGNQ